MYIGCLISFIFIIWFLFPETKGRSLEEIAEVFDGTAETEIIRRASIAASVTASSPNIAYEVYDTNKVGKPG